MSRDLISKSTRNEFRELLTDFTLREIQMIFESGNLVPKYIDIPGISGQRRTLVEQYYANIDFSSPTDIKKLLTAYEEIIEQLVRNEKSASDPKMVRGTIDSLMRRMERDGFRFEKSQFVMPATTPVISTSSLVELSEDSINEHLDKARHKIDNGDNAGAITTAYTLVEQFLKKLLEKLDVSFNQDEGNIQALYTLIVTPLNLNPGGETLESYLKSILVGLKQQITGLYTLANKASDRHARRFNPAKHHAKLAVNIAFCLCEFLLDSYNYQQQRAERKKSDE